MFWEEMFSTSENLELLYVCRVCCGDAGGGVRAHTILGVDFSETSGETE